MTVAQVAQSLRPAFAGIDAGDWVDPTGETRDVTVRLAPEARRADVRSGAIARWSSTVPAGKPVTLPLGQVATIRQGVGPAQINHLEPRPGGERAGQRAGPLAHRGDAETSTRGWRVFSCRRATGSPRAEKPGTSRRCSPGSSLRWARPCC